MSFRLKTICGVAVIEALLLVFMVYSSLDYLKGSNEKAFSSQARTTAMLFAAAAKDATISTDLASLENLVDELMRYEGIAYVSVQSEGGIVLAERFGAGVNPTSEEFHRVDIDVADVDDGVFDMQVGVKEGGEHFGQIKIGFFSSHIDALVADAQKTLIGIGAAKMVLVALFSFLLGTYLTRNLSRLKTAAERLTRGEYGYQIPIHGDDEVSAAANAFNQMSSEILRSKEQLIEAKTVAERSNQSKTDFLMNMTHELRSPLQGIIGFAELGSSRVERLTLEKLKTYFGTISESGNTLLTLVNNLLDLSKAEVGRMELACTPSMMHGIVDKVVSSSSTLISEKLLRVEVTVGDACELQCDSEKIEQVVRNILSNAIKFTEAGGRINIAVESTDDDVVTIISDTGIGIPKDEMDWVFERFVQSSSTKTKAGGTGLGLPIARAIVIAHGGKLNAANNPAGGASFIMTLPRQQISEKRLIDGAQSEASVVAHSAVAA